MPNDFSRLIAEGLLQSSNYASVGGAIPDQVPTNKTNLSTSSSAATSGSATTATVNRPPPEQNVGTAAQGGNQDDSEKVVVTARRDRREPIRYKKSELNVITFPADLNQQNMPHVLFKIFPTQTGEIESTSNEPQRQSAEAAGAEIANIVNKGLQTAVSAAQKTGQAVENTGAYGQAAINTLTAAKDSLRDGATKVVNTLSEGAIGSSNVLTDAAKSFSQFSLNRNADQLALAIALFMPDGVTTNYSHAYDELSLTASLGGIGLFGQALASKTGSSATRDAFIMEGAAALASQFTQKASDLTNALLFTTTGKVVNPQMEMFYKSPNLRTFTFDFRLIPRNQTESNLILAIIQQLKYHSSPEIPSGTTGRYFIPPSRFEIEFYHGNTDDTNPYLFRTKHCVLENISIDYSPNGYASFYDGAPVETRLQLQFKETLILDNNSMLEGY